MEDTIVAKTMCSELKSKGLGILVMLKGLGGGGGGGGGVGEEGGGRWVEINNSLSI